MMLTKEKADLVRGVFEAYHKPEFIYPDPLAVVRTFASSADREIAALICSSLALGRVSGILRAAESVVSGFDNISSELPACSVSELYDRFGAFRYRFFGPDEIVWFLTGIGRTIQDFGSLEACFRSKLARSHDSVLPALVGFAEELAARSGNRQGMLLSDPSKGSAVKRLNLFLRWVVRRDEIDPGSWDGVSPSLLVYPMDTHMLGVARFLNLTHRRQADLRTAVEVTGAFKQLDPEDPVRFDFSLTRPGIHPSLSVGAVFF